MQYSRKQFLAAVENEKEHRRRKSLENPNVEELRIKHIEFRKNIETIWLPTLQEYLTAIGDVWFGVETVLSGSFYRKDIKLISAFTVSYEIYGPMAIFSVKENIWREREKVFEDTKNNKKTKTEKYMQGYRCKIILNNLGIYELKNDDNDTIAQFVDYLYIEESVLLDIFTQAFLEGPKILFYHWDKPFGDR